MDSILPSSALALSSAGSRGRYLRACLKLQEGLAPRTKDPFRGSPRALTHQHTSVKWLEDFDDRHQANPFFEIGKHYGRRNRRRKYDLWFSERITYVY